MNEKEMRRLKEILFALLYAKFFQHGTDGHNARLIMAEQAKELGYRGYIGMNCFLLFRNNELILKVDEGWSDDQ